MIFPSYKFISNTQKIYDWIKENICPYIREDIQIDYGEKHISVQTYETTTTYHLYVSQNPHNIYGDKDYIGASVKFGFEIPMSDIIKNEYDKDMECYLIPIVANWKTIKERLLLERTGQTEKYSCLDNFEV